MSINKVTTDDDGLIVESDLGQMLIGGKRYFLEAGAASMLLLDGTPEPKVTVPGMGSRPTIDITGTTDATLVCLARRRDTAGREAWEGLPKMNDELPIPTVEEARTELASGEDIYHGKWPVPRLIAVPLEEALAEAKRLWEAGAPRRARNEATVREAERREKEERENFGRTRYSF